MLFWTPPGSVLCSSSWSPWITGRWCDWSGVSSECRNVLDLIPNSPAQIRGLVWQALLRGTGRGAFVVMRDCGRVTNRWRYDAINYYYYRQTSQLWRSSLGNIIGVSLLKEFRNKPSVCWRSVHVGGYFESSAALAELISILEESM